MKAINIFALSLLGLAAYTQSAPNAETANEVQIVVDPYLRLQPSDDRSANGSRITVAIPMHQKFFLSPVKLNWYEANYYCSLANLKLVSFNSPTIEAELKGFLSFYGLSNKYYWTAGNRFTTQKNWVWGLNGYNFNINHWADTEPRNATDSNNCLAAVLKRELWYTYDCNTEMDFVCQK
ncbi:perlucin-like [Bactrocera neohumeralis]|uniref:perlucin-like n=1 Tax=Bactrocera neohumeralis TaxID=98809 RepID=UPI0021665EAC|nr:perlucin-like [Bactrocera neohumeralis]